MKPIFKKNGGFTLVELIVVIAILAILAGVAVPAYSGYITKANKQADIILVGELKNAAIMGMLYESNHEFEGPVVVKLSATEAAVIVAENDADKALVEGFVEEVYGDNWEEVCKLRYDGWTVSASDVFESYTNSSLANKEEKLLDTTSAMSNAFANFLSTGKNMPEQITAMMNKYGYTDTSDTTTFANAAVLTLADDFTNRTNAEGVTMGQAVADALASGAEGINGLGDTVAQFYGTGSDDLDMRTLATTAALYAYATAFAEHAADNGSMEAQNQLNTLNETLADPAGMSSKKIMETVMGTFRSIAQAYAGESGTAENKALYNNYFAEDGQSQTDADALMAVMGGVAESADALAANLNSANCYSEATSLVKAYLTAGSVLDNTHPAGVVIGADSSVESYLDGIQ